ncbi:hypothetical protein FB567DRAFT_520750 [Paraphoma chrysanthemicola]|uniref:Uncharacterized protein n=1 Tax=Paraphoma chrysanthemicola TaxID=798071 RepID=A0A8K0VZQ5_9PLEO|nr:hypothetical protein FB567DRAFT_520750 [Paraphoma chrysanthemicola]
MRDAKIEKAKDAAHGRELNDQAAADAEAERKANAKPVPKPSPKAYPNKFSKITGKPIESARLVNEKEQIVAIRQNRNWETGDKKEAEGRAADREQIEKVKSNSERVHTDVQIGTELQQLRGELGESASARVSDVSEKSETQFPGKQAVTPQPTASVFKPATLNLPSANNQSNTIPDAPAASDVTPRPASFIEQPWPSQPTAQPEMGNCLSFGSLAPTPTPLEAPELTTADGGDGQPVGYSNGSDKDERKTMVAEPKMPEPKEAEPTEPEPKKAEPKKAEPEKGGPKKAASKAGKKTGSLLSLDTADYLGTNASDDETSEPKDRGLKKSGSDKPERKSPADPQTPAETDTQRENTEPINPKLAELQEKKPDSGFKFKSSDFVDLDLSASKPKSEMATPQKPDPDEGANKKPEGQKEEVKTSDWKSSQSSSSDQISADGPMKSPSKQQASTVSASADSLKPEATPSKTPGPSAPEKLANNAPLNGDTKTSETPGQSPNRPADTNEKTPANTPQPEAMSQPSATTTQQSQAQESHTGEQSASSTAQSEAAHQPTTMTSPATSIPQLPSNTQADSDLFPLPTNREPLDFNDFPLPDLYTRPVGRPATGMDSKEQLRNRLLGGTSTLAQMRREREASSGVTDSGIGGGGGTGGPLVHPPPAPGPSGGAAEPKNSGDDDDEDSKPNGGGAPISTGGNAGHQDPAVERSSTPENADDAMDIDTTSPSSQPVVSLSSKQVADILANPGIAALLRNQPASNAALVNTSGKDDEMEIDDGNPTPLAQLSAHANTSTAANPDGDIDMQGTEDHTNVQAPTPAPPVQKSLPPLPPQTLDFTPLPVNSSASNPPAAAPKLGEFQPKTSIFGRTSTLGSTSTSSNPIPFATSPFHSPWNTGTSPFPSQSGAPSPSPSFDFTAGQQRRPATTEPFRFNAPSPVLTNLTCDKSTKAVGHKANDSAYQSYLEAKEARQAALPKPAVTPSVPSRTTVSSSTNNLSDILSNISLENISSKPSVSSQTTAKTPLVFTRAQEGPPVPHVKKDIGWGYAPTQSEPVPKASPALPVSVTTASFTPTLGATAPSTSTQSMHSQGIPQQDTNPQDLSSQSALAPSRPASIASTPKIPAQEPVRDDQLIDQKKGRRQQKQPTQNVLDEIIAQTIAHKNPASRPPPHLTPPPRGVADRVTNAMEGVQSGPKVPGNTPVVQALKPQASSVQAPPMQHFSPPAPPTQAPPALTPTQTPSLEQSTQREEVSPAQQSAAEPTSATGSGRANPLENYPTYSRSSSDVSKLSDEPVWEDVINLMNVDTNPRKNQDSDDKSDSSEASTRLRLSLGAADIGAKNFKSNEYVTAEDDASDNEGEETASQREKTALEDGETRRRPDEARRPGEAEDEFDGAPPRATEEERAQRKILPVRGSKKPQVSSSALPVPPMSAPGPTTSSGGTPRHSAPSVPEGRASPLSADFDTMYGPNSPIVPPQFKPSSIGSANLVPSGLAVQGAGIAKNTQLYPNYDNKPALPTTSRTPPSEKENVRKPKHCDVVLDHNGIRNIVLLDEYGEGVPAQLAFKDTKTGARVVWSDERQGFVDEWGHPTEHEYRFEDEVKASDDNNDGDKEQGEEKKVKKNEDDQPPSHHTPPTYGPDYTGPRVGDVLIHEDYDDTYEFTVQWNPDDGHFFIEEDGYDTCVYWDEDSQQWWERQWGVAASFRYVMKEDVEGEKDDMETF